MLTAYTRKGLILAVGLGLGIGLMAGAVFVAASGRPPVTDEEVRSRARALGMVSATELPRPAPVKEPAAVRVAVVYIAGGTDATTVAEMLATAGAVADGKAFVARLTERGLLTAVKVGVHEIPLGTTTVDQVIDIVTGARKP